jgi:PEP-CTERM/exosortase A-associated glycosyltransferase
MRILHILDHSIPLHSGYTFRTRNILRHQAELGWYTCQVTGLKHRAESPPLEEVEGLRFYRTTAPDTVLGRLPIMKQWQVVQTLQRRIEHVIEQEKPHILHAHSPALNGLAALGAARRYGLPVVYECRAFWEDAAVDHGTHAEWGLRYRLSRALETRVFQRADAVTKICEGLKTDIAARGVEAHRITVIPNAVDIEGFRVRETPDDELRARLGLKGKRVIGFVGSFYAYEGLQLLLDAMPQISRHHRDVALLLVGGGPEEDRLQQQAQRLGLGNTVVFGGRVPHAEVQRYYDLLDVLVYPRLPMRLTELVTPLKPLEAMAQGKLVLASDVGGHRELIEDGVNGRFFRAGSSADLVAKVGDMLDTPEHWPVMQARGRTFVEQERNWAASVGRYQPLYEALL